MAHNASRDLGPSSPPNLISSSRGAARNRGEECYVVGEDRGREKGEGEKGRGDDGGGYRGNKVRGSQEGVTSVSVSQMT